MPKLANQANGADGQPIAPRCGLCSPGISLERSLYLLRRRRRSFRIRLVRFNGQARFSSRKPYNHYPTRENVLRRPMSHATALPFLPFTRPTIDETTIAAVADVLRSGW